MSSDPDRQCSACRALLPVASFYKKSGDRPGRYSECKECFGVRNRASYRKSDKARKTVRDAAWRAANPEKQRLIERKARLKKRGMTPEEYDSRLAGQDGRCAVCRSAESGDSRFQTFAVDHDHRTGAVRGLLCARCNLALGHVDDDVDRLMALAAYLLQASDVIGSSA